MTKALEIDARFAGDGHAVLRVTGDMCLEAAAEVHAALMLVELRGASTLVVDLTGAELIDSSGLRVLVDGNRRAAHAGRRLEIVAPPGSVPRRLLELTLLSERLTVLDELRPLIPG